MFVGPGQFALMIHSPVWEGQASDVPEMNVPQISKLFYNKIYVNSVGPTCASALPLKVFTNTAGKFDDNTRIILSIKIYVVEIHFMEK